MTTPTDTDTDDTPVDDAAVVQIGPCLAGHIRTWTRDGDSRLWATPGTEWLSLNQATGRILRTERDRLLWREIALLRVDPGGTTATLGFTQRGNDISDIRADAPGTRSVELEAVGELPSTIPHQKIVEDLVALLTSSIRYCITSGDYLIIERGGWNAPMTHRAMFARVQRDEAPVNLVEAAPAPVDSELWTTPTNPDATSALISAPATLDATDAVPWLLVDAVSGWDVPLHDLALAFLTH